MAQNIQAQLNAGIDAVRGGDKLTAQRLLRQVVAADPNNEIAWMWLASAVDDLEERRACLERALDINPNNRRAQDALRQLKRKEEAQRRQNAALSAEEQRRIRASTADTGGGGGLNIYLVLAALVGVLLIGAVVFAVTTATTTTTTPPPAADSQVSLVDLTPTATIDPQTFTDTPVFGVIVTLDRSRVTLPPTFTPTFTPTATEPPPPSATPFPLESFALVYSGFAADDAQPLLARIRADGSGETRLSDDAPFGDAEIDPTGERIAFVRLGAAPAEVDGEGEEAAPPAPQLFVAPLDDLGAAQPITTFAGTLVANPSWSPDGAQIAVTSNTLGSEDIWIITVDGSAEPRRLTGNTGVDRDPAWSPDGRFIAYASDVDSPAVDVAASTTEIYVIETSGNNPRRLTDASGSSYAPAWSPDGEQIVFVSDRSSDADLYLMDRTGAGENLLTFDDDGAEDRNPVFTPDGRWIAFASNRETDQFQLYLVDPRGDEVIRLTNNDRDLLSLDFFPDDE